MIFKNIPFQTKNNILPMVQDDLSVWLKASAENKINQKNTWQATLIDHFVDINANGNVNFQKASCTLEGCMKVYSTRVDDVSDNTLKLLGIFNKEEDSKKKTTQIKKKSNFIEKNLNNINLKEQTNDSFYDPLFASILSRNDDYSLLDFLEPCDLGLIIYSHRSNDLIMEDTKIDFDMEIRPICDSLKDFEAIQSIDAERITEIDPIMFDDDNDNNQFMDNPLDEFTNVNREDLECNEMCMELEQKEFQQFHETPFGYFRGWAGPSYWKTNLNLNKKSNLKSTKKEKQRYFLDFKSPLDYSALETKADTIMSKDAILERRQSKNFLPEDYSYETKDLYKFNIRDGFFSNLTLNLSNPENMSIDNNNFETNENYINNDVELDNQPFDPDLSFQMENSLNINNDVNEIAPISLKFTKVAKKIDIKKLKENVHRVLDNKINKLSDIFNQITQFYPTKEAKEISPHLCFISILHLANEEGLEIVQQNNDLFIK